MSASMHPVARLALSSTKKHGGQPIQAVHVYTDGGAGEHSCMWACVMLAYTESEQTLLGVMHGHV
eukprot:15230791-Alexandrium_andersonii.AAC.1